MSKFYKRYLTPILWLVVSVSSAYAQTTVSGKVTDASTGEPVVGANVIVKGTSEGGACDINGAFSFTTSSQFPFSIEVSAVSYQKIQKQINSASEAQGINISLAADATTLGAVEVIGPTYGKGEFGNAPVTVEVLGPVKIRQSPAEDAYGAIALEKGVQQISSSLNFPQINTRGFATIANVRFVQLVDWMDVAAPLLNFPTGNSFLQCF